MGCGLNVFGHPDVPVDKLDSGFTQTGEIEFGAPAPEIIEHGYPGSLRFRKRQGNPGANKSRSACDQYSHLECLQIAVHRLPKTVTRYPSGGTGPNTKGSGPQRSA